MYNSIGKRFRMMQISRSLHSQQMRQCEMNFPVNEEQKRWLTFGAVLFTANKDSCRTMDISEPRFKTFKWLSSSWGIESRETALETVEGLAAAEVHVPLSDDFYRGIVKQGFKGPFTVEELVDLPGPGLNIAYAHMVKSLLHPDDIPDAEKYRVHILNNMLGRINNGLYHFKTAKKVLQGLGYSANELEALDSTSAWDYGRCAFIARSCAYTRFLEEDEAWMYMKKAADNASCVYDSWRDFLAGYVAGRALGYGNDSTDIFAILRYLLQSAKSPYNEVPFKSAHP